LIVDKIERNGRTAAHTNRSAARLGISRQAVHQRVACGSLRGWRDRSKPGAPWRFDAGEVAAAAANARTPTTREVGDDAPGDGRENGQGGGNGEASAGGDGEKLAPLPIEKARLERARRLDLEERMAQRRGDLLPTSEVMETWMKVLIRVSRRLRAIGQTAAPRIVSDFGVDPKRSQVVRERIEECVEEAIAELIENPFGDGEQT